MNAFYKNSRIKQYLKDGRVLCIETVIKSPDDLRCHRRLVHLDELSARARAVNRRLLDTEGVGQGAIWSGPFPISVRVDRRQAARHLSVTRTFRVDLARDLRRNADPLRFSTSRAIHKDTKRPRRGWSSNMSTLSVNSRRKIPGALVVGAVASGLFAGAGLGVSPAANATCVSIFGLGGGANCTSNLLSWAVAVGDGAQAHANGSIGGAVAIGMNNTAETGSGSILNLAISVFGSDNSATAQGGLANWATNIGGNNNTVSTTGSLLNTATNILGSGNTVATQAGYANWARNAFGDNNNVTVTGGIANWARNGFGDNNTLTIQAGNANTARNVFGDDNDVTIQAGNGNVAQNLLGDNNTVGTQGGTAGVATNFLGDDNTITSTGGSFNGARNIIGSGNVLTSGGPGSNRNLALNILSGGNRLTAGGPGSNLNAAINTGGGDNTVSAGASGSEPGNLNVGFNFFGSRNTVTAGPGPLSLAGTVLRNDLTVTRTNLGVAINNFGGSGASEAASTSRQSGTVRTTRDRAESDNTAGASTASDKKRADASDKKRDSASDNNKRDSDSE